MKLPDKLYVVVCDEWDGTKYARENCGIYSDPDTAKMAAESMQGTQKIQDIVFWVDEVEFCEVWK